MLGEAMSRGIKKIRFDSEQLEYIIVPGRILNLTEASGIFTNCNFFLSRIARNVVRRVSLKELWIKPKFSLVLAFT